MCCFGTCWQPAGGSRRTTSHQAAPQRAFLSTMLRFRGQVTKGVAMHRQALAATPANEQELETLSTRHNPAAMPPLLGDDAEAKALMRGVSQGHQ